MFAPHLIAGSIFVISNLVSLPSIFTFHLLVTLGRQNVAQRFKAILTVHIVFVNLYIVFPWPGCSLLLVSSVFKSESSPSLV